MPALPRPPLTWMKSATRLASRTSSSGFGGSGLPSRVSSFWPLAPTENGRKLCFSRRRRAMNSWAYKLAGTWRKLQVGIGLQWAALQHTVPVASAGSAHGPLPPKGIVTQFISTQIHITD